MPKVMVLIGDRLKELRQRNLLSQRDLAQKAGIAQSTLVALENNRTEPTFKTLRKLVEALECEPEELRGDHNEPPINTD